MPAELFSPNKDVGYMSTSLFAEKSSFHVDQNAANNLLLVIHAPDGTPGFWPDVDNLEDDKVTMDSFFSTHTDGEYEFVVGRGQQYEILAPAVEKNSTVGQRPYKEMHIRMLSQKPLEHARPMTLKELTAGATEYYNAPSSAASVEMFVPPEAVQFNTSVEKTFRPGEKITNPELEQVIADLEFEAKGILSKEELAALTESTKGTEKEVDDYLKGLDQAFVCWKNG
jgi:hypothetical protein